MSAVPQRPRTSRHLEELPKLKRESPRTLLTIFIFLIFVILFSKLIYDGILKKTPVVPLRQAFLNLDTLCTTPQCLRAISLMLASMNATVNPCDNFYENVCGNWSRGRWSYVEEELGQIHLGIHERLMAVAGNSSVQSRGPAIAIARFHSSCYRFMAQEPQKPKVREILQALGIHEHGDLGRESPNSRLTRIVSTTVNTGLGSPFNVTLLMPLVVIDLGGSLSSTLGSSISPKIFLEDILTELGFEGGKLSTTILQLDEKIEAVIKAFDRKTTFTLVTAKDLLPMDPSFNWFQTIKSEVFKWLPNFTAESKVAVRAQREILNVSSYMSSYGPLASGLYSLLLPLSTVLKFVYTHKRGRNRTNADVTESITSCTRISLPYFQDAYHEGVAVLMIPDAVYSNVGKMVRALQFEASSRAVFSGYVALNKTWFDHLTVQILGECI